SSLSFSDFQFLERMQEDFNKALRIVVTIPLSPEFFFYSYLVFPLFSSNNPWAWRAMPSSFDDPADASLRAHILRQRRLQAVVSSVLALKADTLGGCNEALRREREGQLKQIESALRCEELDAALQQLSSFFSASSLKDAKKLRVTRMPSRLVKECVRCIGEEGVWDLPLVRSFNGAALHTHLQRLQRSDAFLVAKGPHNLAPQELQAACAERGMSAGSGVEGQVRELQTWLSLVATSPSGGGLQNEHNKRFALLALHAARDFRHSDFAATYRALLQ
ncbi:hypothetical protein EON64_09645, partial [archaeon]